MATQQDDPSSANKVSSLSSLTCSPSPISFFSGPDTASPIHLSPAHCPSPVPTVTDSIAEYEEACALPSVCSLICIEAPPVPTSELGDYEDLPHLKQLEWQELIYPDDPTEGATSISIDMRGVGEGQEALQQLQDTLSELQAIMTNQEDLAALEAPLVCIKEQLEAGKTLAEAMDTDTAAGWSTLPRVEPDEQQQEDNDHPGLPFQMNSAHSPNYVTHQIQDGSGGLRIPKYVTFMYSMQYPQIMGTMGQGKLNFNWPLQARPAPGSAFYPHPRLTQCKINIFLEDGGDGGFYNMVDDALKMLDDPYLSAEVEFLHQMDHDLEMEANELEAV
jgi:hypothetical protein